MDIEQLRTKVEAITAAVAEIRQSGITEAALLTLIQQASPSVKSGYTTTKPSKKIIYAVLEGMESLQDYVFGTEKEYVEATEEVE